MKFNNLLFIAIIIFIIGNDIFALTANTVYGDCNSTDKSKRFMSKTLIDIDGENGYDHTHIRWCNGETTDREYDPKQDGKIISNSNYQIAAELIHGEDFAVRIDDGSYLFIEEATSDSTANCYNLLSDDQYLDIENGNIDILKQQIGFALSVNNILYISNYVGQSGQDVIATIKDSEGRFIYAGTSSNLAQGWNLSTFSTVNTLNHNETYSIIVQCGTTYNYVTYVNP